MCKEGYSYANLCSIFVISFFAYSFNKETGALLPIVLMDPRYYNIPQSQINGVVTSLKAYTEIPHLFSIIVVGYLYDLIGRKMSLGILWIASTLLIAIIPLPAPHVYPWLLIIRIG